MSYFPSDIPYMTNEEMEEHGINAKREQGMEQGVNEVIVNELNIQFKNLGLIDECINDVKNALVDISKVCKEEQKNIDEAYQRGLTDAWETARKIVLSVDDGGLSVYDVSKIFGDESSHYVLKNYSAAEAIEKLKTFEEKQKADAEIKVGDERMKAKRIMNEDCVFLYWTCSNCGSIVLEHDNFCSNCGADFR